MWDPSSVSVRGVRESDWDTLVELMGPGGVGGGCWCQWWRVERGGKTWEACKGGRAREAFRAEIEAGTVHGSLAFAADEPAGWCRYGPVSEFPRLLNSRSLYRDPPEGTWSIVCFYVPARHRRRGVATAMLHHALETIGDHDPPCIEAYPVPDRTAKGEPAPPAFAWTGVEAMFRDAGFEAAAPTLGKRMVWRREPAPE